MSSAWPSHSRRSSASTRPFIVVVKVLVVRKKSTLVERRAPHRKERRHLPISHTAPGVTRHLARRGFLLPNTEMLIPVRCFTCGKVIGDKHARYTRLCAELQENVISRASTVPGRAASEPAGSQQPHLSVQARALDALGIKRYCCRRMFLTHVDLADRLLLYEKSSTTRVDE